MGFAGDPDAMLMTLLAGQAAVDCERLPIGGWEEVESWKKVGSVFMVVHDLRLGKKQGQELKRLLLF